MKLQKKEIRILEGILNKALYNKKINRKEKLLMDYKKFLSLLNYEERKLITKIQNIDISKYNKKTPFYGILSIPSDLVMIRGQKHKLEKKIPVQFLPKQVYHALKKMNQEIKKDLKRSLIVRSGYRSPSYQMMLFLRYLKEDNWQIAKTLKRVALPGYSEHGFTQNQGIDLCAFDSGIEAFAKTQEYKWLLKNANKFGFYLSYPRSNKSGVMFEPWHWHYEKGN